MATVQGHPDDHRAQARHRDVLMTTGHGRSVGDVLMVMGHGNGNSSPLGTAGPGSHIFQYTYGCEVGPEGSGGAFRRLAFNGRDFLSFDVARQRWDALVPEAGATQRLWNGAVLALPYYSNFAAPPTLTPLWLARRVQESLARANEVALETFQAMATVRSFANEDGAAGCYRRRLHDTYRLHKQEAIAYAASTWTSSVRDAGTWWHWGRGGTADVVALGLQGTRQHGGCRTWGTRWHWGHHNMGLWDTGDATALGT
nr:PREDICTED: uncharacterized protein LOC104139336 [Struthio camelus australis]